MSEKKLVRLFRSLSGEQRQTVMAFVEFLTSRQEAGAGQLQAQPEPIPRPEQESMVKAIKRLLATYPMLERGKLLHETSACMTRHVMQGRPAAEVIDELEIVFARHYERHREGGN